MSTANKLPSDRQRVSDRIPRLKWIALFSLLPMVIIAPLAARAFIQLLHLGGLLQMKSDGIENYGLIWVGLDLWYVLGFSLAVATSIILLLAHSERLIIRWIYAMIGFNILLAVGLSLLFKTPIIAIGEIFSTFWYWKMYKWIGFNPVVLIKKK